jgi:hypothetical protein
MREIRQGEGVHVGTRTSGSSRERIRLVGVRRLLAGRGVPHALDEAESPRQRSAVLQVLDEPRATNRSSSEDSLGDLQAERSTTGDPDQYVSICFSARVDHDTGRHLKGGCTPAGCRRPYLKESIAMFDPTSLPMSAEDRRRQIRRLYNEGRLTPEVATVQLLRLDIDEIARQRRLTGPTAPLTVGVPGCSGDAAA